VRIRTTRLTQVIFAILTATPESLLWHDILSTLVTVNRRALVFSQVDLWSFFRVEEPVALRALRTLYACVVVAGLIAATIIVRLSNFAPAFVTVSRAENLLRPLPQNKIVQVLTLRHPRLLRLSAHQRPTLLAQVERALIAAAPERISLCDDLLALVASDAAVAELSSINLRNLGRQFKCVVVWAVTTLLAQVIISCLCLHAVIEISTDYNLGLARVTESTRGRVIET